jgi:citrate lyase synthetase
MNYLTQEKTFHYFIFTKAKYAASFKHLHFNLLAKTDEAAFLENGTSDIQDYLHDMPKIDD